jgi:two-component system, response regulator, stage 0 sporulation protein F
MKPFRLLVAEDEPSIREPLAIFLKAQGYKVDTAENGIEALNYLREKTYDLITLDLKMPYIDGTQLTQIMQNESIKTPILVISAIYDGEKIFQECGRIIKPFELKQVAQMINDFITNNSK